MVHSTVCCLRGLAIIHSHCIRTLFVRRELCGTTFRDHVPIPRGIVAEFADVWNSYTLNQSQRLIELAALANILFAACIGIWSLYTAEKPLAILAFFYTELVHVSQSAPSSGNDFFGYARHTFDLFAVLLLLFIMTRRKIFLAPPLISALIALAAIAKYL